MPERFSASNAAKHMACPASANLELAIPNWVPPVRSTVGAATEGTRKHEIFASIMELGAKDLHHFASAIDYVAQIRSTRRFKVLVEQEVKATWLNGQTTTADLVLYTQDEIHVIDLKAGKIPVEVIDNVQLLFYGACYAPLAPKAKGVNLHIVQPWANGNASWYVSTAELKAFMDEAKLTQAKIDAGDTTFGPSDNCMFCPANPHSRGDKGRPFCPARMQQLYPVFVDDDDILNL